MDLSQAHSQAWILAAKCLAAPYVLLITRALPVDLRNIGALPIIKISDKGQYPVNGLQAAGEFRARDFPA